MSISITLGRIDWNWVAQSSSYASSNLTFNPPAEWPNVSPYGETSALPDWDLLAAGTPPSLVYHYYAAASYHWDGPDGVGGQETEDCTVGARTLVILLTGGKSGVARKSLFCINGGANQNGWRTTAYGAYWTTKAVADKTSLQTLGRHFGADGKLWVVLPDNTAQDLTVTAPPDDYDAWPTDASGVQKYTLAIQANNVTLEPDVVVDGATNFCVGEKLGFNLDGLPASVTVTDFRWSLTGTFVNDSSNAVPGKVYPECSINYFQNPSLLAEAVLTNCWWVSGGNDPYATYTASVSCTLHFNNGNPDLPYGTDGLFSMFRPNVGWTGFMPGTVEVDDVWELNYGKYALHFGTIYSTPLYTKLGMTFTKDVLNGGVYAGASYYYPIQIFSSYSSENCGTNGMTAHLSGSGLDKMVNGLASYTANNKQVYYDDPGMSCGDGNHHESYEASFQAYLMFDPQTGGSIGVPLKRIDWNWSGAAEAIGGGVWQKISTAVPAITANNIDELNFPIWTNRIDLQLPMHGVTIYTNTTCN